DPGDRASARRRLPRTRRGADPDRRGDHRADRNVHRMEPGPHRHAVVAGAVNASFGEGRERSGFSVTRFGGPPRFLLGSGSGNGSGSGSGGWFGGGVGLGVVGFLVVPGLGVRRGREFSPAGSTRNPLRRPATHFSLR